MHRLNVTGSDRVDFEHVVGIVVEEDLQMGPRPGAEAHPEILEVLEGHWRPIQVIDMLPF